MTEKRAGRGLATVSFSEIRDAFAFVSFGSFGGHVAYLDRKTGEIYCHSEDNPIDGEELPEDIEENEERYVALPDKQELDLGRPLVLDFASQFLPDDYDEVRAIFSHRGAYARFKDLLIRRGALQRWYDFSDKAEEAALRQWCADNGIVLKDEPAAAAEKKD